MWDGYQELLFWPLLGEPVTQQPVALDIFHSTSFTPDAFLLEGIGLVIMLTVAGHYRLYHKENLLEFLRTGHLD